MGDYTVIGIDFGTSTTVVKTKNYGEGVDLDNWKDVQFNNSNSLPTLIFEAGEDGRLSYGYQAEIDYESDLQMDNDKKGRLHKYFKMDLISADPGTKKKAEELTSAFFVYLHDTLVEQGQTLHIKPETKTYISFPAKWKPDLRRFMKKCAEDAGFKNVEGVFEPTAAVYASMSECCGKLQDLQIIIKNKPVNIIMLDMGAGTTDIAIFKFKIDNDGKLIGDEEKTVTWPAPGNYNCGGKEIDEVYLTDELRGHIAKIAKDRKVSEFADYAIKTSVKRWKEYNVSRSLGEKKSTGLPAPVATHIKQNKASGAYENLPFEDIDRKRFELITEKHWKEFRTLIDESLREASKELSDFKGAEDVDLVILTGGHSQWYGVKEFILGEKFAGCEPINFAKIRQNPVRLLQMASPQETVAKGLVFKDLGFNLKNTMGKSLWVQYDYCGHKSDLVKIIGHHDVLPIKNFSLPSYEFNIERHMLETGKLPFYCHCYYGEDPESAKLEVWGGGKELQTAAGQIFSRILFPPLIIADGIRVIGRIVSGDESWTNNMFTIGVFPSVNVPEDGSTVEITVTLKSKNAGDDDWKKVTPFKITLGEDTLGGDTNE